VSLGLNVATIARIEADRIYSLILPETDGETTVTVPASFLENLIKTGRNLERYAPSYVKMAMEKLEGTAEIRKWRKKAVIPRQSLADVAAAFRIAADTAEGMRP
jgi:hypothetical protein